MLNKLKAAIKALIIAAISLFITAMYNYGCITAESNTLLQLATILIVSLL